MKLERVGRRCDDFSNIVKRRSHMQGQVPQQHITDVRGLERLSIVEAYVRSELYLPGQTVVGTLPFFREALLRSASGRVRD